MQRIDHFYQKWHLSIVATKLCVCVNICALFLCVCVCVWRGGDVYTPFIVIINNIMVIIINISSCEIQSPCYEASI